MHFRLEYEILDDLESTSLNDLVDKHKWLGRTFLNIEKSADPILGKSLYIFQSNQ